MNLTTYQALRINVKAHKREVFRRLQAANGKGGRIAVQGSFANVRFYRTLPLIGTPERWQFIVRPSDAFAAMIEVNPARCEFIVN